MRNALIGTLMLLSSLPATAGDWHSGGGEVIRDTQNPWFLNNTPSVDVCLLWDQRFFHPVDQTLDGLKARFDASIRYWKREFSRALLVKRYMAVGTQDFQVVAAEVVGQQHQVGGELGDQRQPLQLHRLLGTAIGDALGLAAVLWLTLHTDYSSRPLALPWTMIVLVMGLGGEWGLQGGAQVDEGGHCSGGHGVVVGGSGVGAGAEGVVLGAIISSVV